MQFKQNKLLQAMAAVLALNAWQPQAQAETIEFNYSGDMTTWTVPTTGTYNIVAYGAAGGSVFAGATGGFGAQVGGSFNLMANQVLRIAVGGAGQDGSYGSGGGGGSFVVFDVDNAILAIAGGGGGGGGFYANTGPGDFGGNGNITSGNGLGGGGFSGAGGGFNGDGLTGSAFSGAGGLGFANGLIGGANSAYCNDGDGGFGGGGGGGCWSGGGGGGYTGGSGGNYNSFTSPQNGGGGGGFSKNNAIGNFINVAGVRSGNGLVQISYDFSSTTNIPEPGTLSLIGLGVAAGWVRRHQRRRTTLQL